MSETARDGGAAAGPHGAARPRPPAGAGDSAAPCPAGSPPRHVPAADAPRRRPARRLAACLLAALPLFAAPARGAPGVAGSDAASSIAEARYAAPAERYGHYALGRPHEYARLDAVTGDGRALHLELPGGEVFEDLVPRVVRLAPAAPARVLAIVSARASGSRLALYGVRGGRLQAIAESAPIGTPMRWLNPVGVADLDGDGQAEIAAVVTPHIGGTLKVWRLEGTRLVEVAALQDFSNHAYGTAELGLSLAMPVGGRMRLVVPDAARGALRVVGMEDGRLVEVARCPLQAPLAGPLVRLSGSTLAIERPGGRELVVPADCPPPR